MMVEPVHGDIGLSAEDRVLVLGGTGFVGSRIVPELIKKNIKLRLLVRDPSKVAPGVRKNADIEVMRGDLVKNEGLREALYGIHSVYYLVHSMGGKSVFRNKVFAARDKHAAMNFMAAAESEGLRRVVYLGGLGEKGDKLSEHLRSRAEIAEILFSGRPLATILHAAVIIGAGGASFEMLRYLVERLPIMVCPKWIDTRIQPIAIRDVLAYLVGCLLNPETAGKRFDICGPDILTYRLMMHQYAEARGLRRRIIVSVPFLTALFSAYWVDLITPIPSGIAHPLIAGLKNEVICRDHRLIHEFVPINTIPFKEAVRIAFAEEKDGPGITGW